MDTHTDLTYSDEQLKLREDCLKILLNKFGGSCDSQSKIYNCADEWISKGHKISNGLVAYYKTYYETKRPNQINQISTKKR